MDNKSWYTCTPVRFLGDHTFFARDSGLLCMGFNEIGIKCKAIMPGPVMANDQTEDLIRTDYKNLEDPEWWRQLGGKGVVLYAWGMGKYRKIAEAIRKSGMILVSHLDTGGILGIINGIPEYSGSLWRCTLSNSNSYLVASLQYATRFCYAVSIGLIRNDLGRAIHLQYADIIGSTSPIALERIKNVCRIYGGDDLASRVHLIPHPNASYMTTGDTVKERLMVAIGRWDDEKVKGTEILKETCKILLEKDADLQIEIYGPRPVSMDNWHKCLDPQTRKRLHLVGLVPNIELRKALQRAQVELCTSLTESNHTVSAEALCCGCSVVGPDVPEIPSMKWFTTPYGTLTPRTAEALSLGVLAELKAWDKADRIPSVISDHWTKIFHAPNVARRILDLADKL